MSIPKFLEYIRHEKNYSIHTVQAYQNDLKEFSAFYYSENQTHQLGGAEKIHLRNYLMILSSKSLSVRSINRKISSLKSYYKYLLKIGEIETSPAAGLKVLKNYNKPQIPFSEAEMQNLLLDNSRFKNDFEGIRDQLIIEMLYQTGIRRSELINLTETDISFQDQFIKVNGKRNKQRIIPVGENLMKLISQYIQIRSEKFPQILNPLFLTKLGKPLYDKLVYKCVNVYLGQVSTKDKKSPHVLRHSFATQLLDKGAELNSIKELMGHASLAATQVYTHGSIDQLKKVFNQAHPREQKN